MNKKDRERLINWKLAYQKQGTKQSKKKAQIIDDILFEEMEKRFKKK